LGGTVWGCVKRLGNTAAAATVLVAVGVTVASGGMGCGVVVKKGQRQRAGELG